MVTTFSRGIYRSVIQLPTSTLALPPIYLLPFCARLSTIANTTDPEPQPSAYKSNPTQSPANKLHQLPQTQQPRSSRTELSDFKRPQSIISDVTPSQTALSQTALTPSTTIQESLPPLLPLLAAQLPHYVTAHIHAHPYLLTEGDTLRLPFLMPSAPLGTVLRLNRASMLGSRDYTLRGNPWVNEGWFVCRARVVGVETEPLRVVEKTKRRQRRVKKAKNKMRFTILRVTEVGVIVPENGTEAEAGYETTDKTWTGSS
ncbi:MAG: hypothetical protein LQ344_006895 [Seirophora lacunosa]|nr:MAG: hypothetical protein LQ344_006895 [Seirophora lacunosa]